VAALIDQHAVNGGAQISAVVQVKAAQVKLVRLAFAAVLADDQAGHRFQHFTRAVNRADVKLLLRELCTLTGAKLGVLPGLLCPQACPLNVKRPTNKAQVGLSLNVFGIFVKTSAEKKQRETGQPALGTGESLSQVQVYFYKFF
jgi:hypothetical protein